MEEEFEKVEPFGGEEGEIEDSEESPFIIFLDMDGVLNNPRVCLSLPKERTYNPFGWIDPICVNFVNKWADHITKTYYDEVRIVMSSTWRGAHESSMSLDMMFGAMGLAPLLHQDFKTRRTGMTVGGQPDIRGNQIAEWLLDHDSITKWMILDDDGDFLDYQVERMVKTDHEDGIRTEHHYRALEVIEKIYSEQTDV